MILMRNEPPFHIQNHCPFLYSKSFLNGHGFGLRGLIKSASFLISKRPFKISSSSESSELSQPSWRDIYAFPDTLCLSLLDKEQSTSPGALKTILLNIVVFFIMPSWPNSTNDVCSIITKTSLFPWWHTQKQSNRYDCVFAIRINHGLWVNPRHDS